MCPSTSEGIILTLPKEEMSRCMMRGTKVVTHTPDYRCLKGVSKHRARKHSCARDDHPHLSVLQCWSLTAAPAVCLPARKSKGINRGNSFLPLTSPVY